MKVIGMILLMIFALGAAAILVVCTVGVAWIGKKEQKETDKRLKYDRYY